MPLELRKIKKLNGLKLFMNGVNDIYVLFQGLK